MFQTTETAGALKTAHVDGCVAEHFARRTPIRSRIESVREQIAILSHNRHHGREVEIETEHAQHFAGDSSKRARGREIAMLANRACGGHRRKDLAEAVDEATFLIDAAQRRRGQKFASTVEQRAQLLWAGDVAAEDDDAAG